MVRQSAQPLAGGEAFVKARSTQHTAGDAIWGHVERECTIAAGWCGVCRGGVGGRAVTGVRAVQVLADFDVACEVTVVSAHRTPERMFEYARTAHTRGIKVRRAPHSRAASVHTHYPDACRPV